MKRRAFLTTSGTVGVFGAVSATSVASSVFNSINTSVLLEEFDTETRAALDNFLAKTTENIQSLELDEKLAKQIVMPVRIISKDAKNQSIVYKNKQGAYVSLSVNDGVETVSITSSL